MKVVLAYSGGLDTSVILKWLQEEYGAEVIAYIADVGQEEDLEEAKEKAIKTGASKVYVEDLKEEFVKDFVWRAVKANASYEGYLLGTSLARPLIAKRQVEIALKENADAVAHGATGKGNDQVRFELTYKALAPNLKIIAPWREWKFEGRGDLIDYAREKGIPVPVTKEKPYSSDANLVHISYEGGILEDPWREPDDSMFKMTVSPESAPDEPEYITITFEKGEPVAVNGRKMSPYELLKSVNEIAGRNGIGRTDIVENRLVGLKSRGVYESPGLEVLITAHRAVESLTLERDTAHFKEMVAVRYAELIYYGQWYHPLREAIDAFIDRTQEYVNGEARLKLYKGKALVVGRRSDDSLYDPELASFEKAGFYDQKDAEGFINLFGLPIKVIAIKRKK